ncbi:hypothetical protein NM688_g1453 [Phlebia brevispora]|uniref:Uncharacterized protein n=1 Tax=Phlebia brevispora TaxID=194682 RepID=A0ACC1TBS4_9APHY|nr:hypothetical protein NM688_g1453 [Phlebia brevispora]
MASTIKLAPQLHRIASQWPVDPFRPHLQLKTFLGALADHPQLTPQAVRAARALENSEFQKKYRLSDKMLRPASMPLYYSRLVEGFEKSAQGIARPRWKIFFGIW